MISTIDSESTSRSSVNDLSSWTSSVGTPATSLTMSARSARTSSVVGIGLRAPWGWTVDGPEVVSPGICGWERSWQHDHLTGIHQARAEADDQAGLAAASLTGGQQSVDRERDGGRRGVALPLDVATH